MKFNDPPEAKRLIFSVFHGQKKMLFIFYCDQPRFVVGLVDVMEMAMDIEVVLSEVLYGNVGEEDALPVDVEGYGLADHVKTVGQIPCIGFLIMIAHDKPYLERLDR
jgi:hypothetical protein